MALLTNSEFIVLVSFLLFVGLLYYYGVHTKLMSMLDSRADRIRVELDEARRLREEAQKAFADFERRRGDVQQQAEEIVSRAREEAERAAERAKVEIEESIHRRLRAADEQIAMAEASAVQSVRNRAVQVAVAAAAEVLRERMSPETSDRLIDQSIESVGERLH